jgi:hypothetical protein
MSLPKKIKYTINTNPVKPGCEYLKYGFDRIEELMVATDTKTKYLPRTILLEDIDGILFELLTIKLFQLFISIMTVGVNSAKLGSLLITIKTYQLLILLSDVLINSQVQDLVQNIVYRNLVNSDIWIFPFWMGVK